MSLKKNVSVEGLSQLGRSCWAHGQSKGACVERVEYSGENNKDLLVVKIIKSY